MPIDFANLLDAPSYNILGVPAIITPPGATPVALTVLDKTEDIEEQGAGGVVIPSRAPAVDLRISELTEKGLARADLHDAEVTLDGTVHRVLATLPVGNRRELRLILTEVE